MALSQPNQTVEAGGNLDKISFAGTQSQEQLALILQELKKLNNNIVILLGPGAKSDGVTL